MSRCFPFPPPGYEKKTTTDDLGLLKKEKQKEKKHKKEKKDREKRDGKDKSDGKNREKKDKKEKSRDKKKDKDRDSDKDKSSYLDDKRFPEGHNGEKVSNEKRSVGRSEGHNGGSVSHEKRLPLQPESHSGEKIISKEKDKHRNNFSNERSSAGQFAHYNGEKVSRSIPLAEDAQDSKFAQELDRRVREDVEGVLNPVGKAAVNGAGGGNDKKDKSGADRKIDGQEIRGDTSFTGNSMVENFTIETRMEESAKPLEPNVDKKMEGKEKTKDKGGDDKRRDKRKDRDKEKKGEGKDKEKDKERKEEKKKKKAREKKENKALEQDQVKESIKNDIVGIHDVKGPYLSEDNNQSAASEENLRKRKDTMTNGFLHANESGPNKLPRPTLPSHSLPKNGRITDPCQTLTPIHSDRQGAATNLKVDSSKDLKVNGTSEAQLPSSTKTPLGTAQAGPIAEALKIQPHPDSKYLSQILSVPKLEEVPDVDEHNWLFSSGNSLSKKSKLGSFRDEEAPMVWSQALRIESADVYALPYVIPY